MPDLKRCCTCYEDKPLADFVKDRSRKDGLKPNCQPCRRDIHKKYKYGVENYEELYAELLENQNGKCALCGKEEKVIDSRTGKTHRLCLDHHHGTGKIRGLLCRRCNYLVGMMEGVSHSWLKKAWQYIRNGGIS